MRPVRYRNISFATAENLRAVLRDGSRVEARGARTKELTNLVTVIERPLERCLFVPRRENSVFATIAETFWVLAGRADVEWLLNYLSNAADYSDDDGLVWPGGYGPRLRDWRGAGIDQIDEVRKLLSSESASRRGVMVLFDPARDFGPSNDIPCNNWLSWLIRGDRLHLNVAIRSNDAILGFSGINAFEWSVLQEMMAFWLGVEVGEVTYFATSFHVYEKDYGKAEQIVSAFHGVTCYDFGVERASFQTPWSEFSNAMKAWFAAEERIRKSPNVPLDVSLRSWDPFLASTLRVLRLKWGAITEKWDQSRIRDELHALPDNDFTAASYDRLARRRPCLLEGIPQPGIASFFQAYRDVKAGARPGLRSAVKALHAKKNAAYGPSWKRRGERISILPNIARKVDRLAVFAAQKVLLESESVLDTAIDLFVYLTKYRLFLADQEPTLGQSFLSSNALVPYSDGTANFDHLVDQSMLEGAEPRDSDEEIACIEALFEELWPTAEAGGSLERRLKLAGCMSASVERLIAGLVRDDPTAADAFVRTEVANLNWSIDFNES